MKAYEWSFNYIAITNDPDKAKIYNSCLIQQIMVDAEKRGKVERQGHKDTIISDHSLSDITALKSLNLDAEIICRINPFYRNIFQEIDIAIENGADAIMLPMITNIHNYKSMIDRINGRTKVIPLIETPYSFFKLNEILEYSTIGQIHFGLNDLCIGLGMDNLFEVLLSDTFKDTVSKINGIKMGIGGIGDPQINHKVNPLLLLNRYMKYGSNSVILSRSFFPKNCNQEYIVDSLKIFENNISRGYSSLLDHQFKIQVHEG